MIDLFELEAQQDALGTTEAGPAHMQPSAPVSQLTKHWQAASLEYINASAKAPAVQRTSELLALGAIRAVYWLALGNCDVALAKAIGQWWADYSPLHGLGETIK